MGPSAKFESKIDKNVLESQTEEFFIIKKNVPS